MKKRICFGLLFLLLLLNGCSLKSEMKDGFYTAEMSDYSHGWKEYLCILVKNDKIVYAEFNAKDPSGYIKAWDNSYMRNMLTYGSTYPNEYTRAYVSQLVESQNPDEVDAVTGASHSGGNFAKLSAAVVEQALKGDSTTIIVESAEE